MGLLHAGIAHLAVVITPVGVVHVVAHKVVNLLGGTVLRTPLTRSRHEGQSKFVLLAEFLLDGTVVAE